MEIMVKSYIQDIGMRAKAIADVRKKIDKDCFIFLVRKDTRKFRRVNDLLSAFEEIKSVQKTKLPDESTI
jgi:hypothetical protein